MSNDARLHFPATARNRDAILEVLLPKLPKAGLVLEVASGSGEHVTHFAKYANARLQFQPSDPEPDARASIDAWVLELALTNVRPALALDTTSQEWGIEHADGVVCINMIHVAPWEAAIGLFRGAAKTLAHGGRLFLYGPFRCNGEHTAASNAEFDANLRTENPAWGVRDIEAVVALAQVHGFKKEATTKMPANNLWVEFVRSRP